jgi:hypothetical protein
MGTGGSPPGPSRQGSRLAGLTREAATRPIGGITNRPTGDTQNLTASRAFSATAPRRLRQILLSPSHSNWPCEKYGLAQLAQNRGSALGKSKAYPKSRHYIFGRVAGDQALATSACCSCSARRMRFGKTMPRRSRRVACAASGWVTQRRRIWPWEAVGNTTSLD